MILRIGNFQFRLYMSILEKRIGVCSQKATTEDKHILLWDFDNSKISKINKTLKRLSIKHKLPTIYVISSSPYSYHAYCFTSRPFRETIHILSDTPELDENYFRLGIVRGYFTLRITPRKDEYFKMVKIIKSIYKDEMARNDVTINEYLTSNKGGKQHAKRKETNQRGI